MATSVVNGQMTWSMKRDREGQREYKISYYVRGLPTDGPATVLQTEGLPIPGDFWVVGTDSDLWATCKQDADISPVIDKEPNVLWKVEFTFSTKGDEKRCKDQNIEDPLLIPQRLSGSFQKYTEEAAYDRFGDAIANSAHEQLRGPQVEFDANRPVVKIEQNVPLLQLSLIASMRDKVNQFPLWGLPPRCIKLSNISWTRKYYGLCYEYYERSFEFDIRYDGFDRDILDEGTKVLNGHWDVNSGGYVVDDIGIGVLGNPIVADPDNPQHFIRFKDRNGENCKVILNGMGLPAGVHIGTGTAVTSYYVCINGFDSTGDVPGNDDTIWLPVNGQGPEGAWSPTTEYFQGDIVGSGDSEYVCVEQNTGIDPGANSQPTDPAAPWLLLSGGTSFEGDWNPTTTYSGGDPCAIVQFTTGPATEEVGKIHVEKYDEADFTLLGIPTTF